MSDGKTPLPPCQCGVEPRVAEGFVAGSCLIYCPEFNIVTASRHTCIQGGSMQRARSLWCNEVRKAKKEKEVSDE